MKKILLHVCCAPCSTHAIEELMKMHDVVLFFSNSNIFPHEEYLKRLREAEKVARAYGLELIEDTYGHDAWLNAVRGFEQEPEGGRRCLRCFAFNLKRTSEKAQSLAMDGFTTTLTISPHKDSAAIMDIGKGFPGFLAIDFKEHEGFKHSLELSKDHGLYRQRYCGCEFGIR